MNIKVSYVTHTPIVAGSPSISIENSEYDYINVALTDHYENKTYNGQLNKSNNFSLVGPKQWYGDWEIILYNPSEKQIYTEKFNPKNKTVFIKSDARALGDNLAWIDYIDQFRIKHDCNVICSTFWNELFTESYPNLMFVKPNTRIDNVYAQYYIGTHNTSNPIYQPSLYLNNPLQKIAADILGLDYKESIAKIKLPTYLPKKKQITLSEYASLRVKEWNVVGGWQAIVDYFNSIGFEVVVISKEPSYLKNVTNKSGDIPLEDRIKDMYQSQYHVGLSTGLSWLAQSCGTHTFLISDFTPPNHEIQSNTTRIYNENSSRQIISYSEVTSPVTLDHVLHKIENQLKLDGHI